MNAEFTLFIIGVIIAFVSTIVYDLLDKAYKKLLKPTIIKKYWKVPYIYYQPNIEDCGDCSIRAFTKLLNNSWEDSFDLMSKKAKKRHLNMDCYTLILEILKDNGYILIDIEDKMYSFSKIIRHLENISGLDGQYYAIISSNHICACKDGKLYDSWDSRAMTGKWLALPNSITLNKEMINNKLKFG